MSEQAAIWQRVSTDGQDEASQLPDLVKWCDAHGYDVAERYVVHGKSAYHGKHAATLDEAFNAMAAGKFTVLVVWAADRIERRGALAALMLAERARQAGGRIEYVKDSHLNSSNDMSDTMLALAADMARNESRRKSERILAKQASLRSAGSVVGRPAWGYRIEQRGNVKVLVPTPEGRKYVPLVFRHVVNGWSLRQIAAWLDSEGVSTESGKRWNEGYVGNRLIKNPVYYGQRRNAGQLETEPLVTYNLWLEANAALNSRVKRGRSTVVREKAFLAPLCGACYGQEREGCPSGKSPMYRVYVPVKDGRKAYYRCTGHGPQRKGCGAPMAPVDDLDATVTEAMLGDQMNMHVERVFIPGNDRSDEIGKIRQQAMDAYASGDKARFRDLDAQADALEAIPFTAPHWEEQQTEQTEGDYFASLDTAGRREYLTTREVVAERDESGARATIVPKWAVA